MPRPPVSTVGAYEAKSHLSELLEKVAAGEEFTITRHGTPVARLVPVSQEHSRQDRRAAIERMTERRDRLSLQGLKIPDLIREGRR